MQFKLPAWFAAVAFCCVHLMSGSRSSAEITAQSFATHIDFLTGYSPWQAISVDVDGDGKLDLITSNNGGGDVSVLRNLDMGPGITVNSFNLPVNFPARIGTGIDPTGIAAGDIDRDGKKDLVIANYKVSTIAILKNTSVSGTIDANSFAAAVEFQSGPRCIDVILVDLDGDNKLDIVTANLNGHSLSVFRNQSTVGVIDGNTLAARIDIPVAGSPFGVAAADLDGDGKSDLVSGDYEGASGLISVVRNVSTVGNMSFEAHIDYTGGGSPIHFVIADLDADGKRDIISANLGHNTVSVLKNTTTGAGSFGAGSFAAKVDFGVASGPRGVIVADLEGDGKPDIATSDLNSGTVSILNNVSTPGSITPTSFAPAIQFFVGSQPYILGSGDLDGDGDIDIFTPSRSPSLVNVLENLSTHSVLEPGVLVTTLAGSTPGLANGQGSQAQFNAPNGGYVDQKGNLYIADGNNHAIRVVTPDGNVTTLAGTGQEGYIEGPASTAKFSFPLAVFADPAGNVFVTDTGNSRIRLIQGSPPVVSWVTGSGIPGYLDGNRLQAQFNFPNEIVRAASGDLLVSEFNNHTIRKITFNGTVSTFVGDGTAGYVDGNGTNARLNRPAGLAFARDGTLFVSEWGNQRIRKITTDGTVSTFAGTGETGFRDGPTSQAKFDEPDSLAIDSAGNLYVAEHGNHTVRKISLDGKVTTIAGRGTPGYRDGDSSVALFDRPSGLGIGTNGTLFVADTGNHRIRKIEFGSPPQIVTQPKSQTVAPGANVTLQVVASGTPSFGYQWRLNKVALIGETRSDLILANVTVHSAGEYCVVVSNSFGSTLSADAVVTVNPFLIAAQRQLPSFYSPGVKFVVSVITILPDTATVYAVEDHPPQGWVVGNVSHGGRLDAPNGAVKFGPFFDASRTLTYEITPSLGSGDKTFAGTISIDGVQGEIAGVQAIGLAPLHPADASPADSRITIGEITAYGTAWRKGQAWINPPNPIPIDYVTRAGALWRNGETYHVDPSIPTPPLWWVNDTAAPSLASIVSVAGVAISELSTVVALAPDYFVPGHSFTVTLSVRPADDVSAYAVGEQIEVPGGFGSLPESLQVTSVSNGGIYDNGEIRWGPFFDKTSRTLTYEVQIQYPPPQAVNLSGVGSFDGASVDVRGKRDIPAASRFESITNLSGGRVQIQLASSVTNVVEVSTNLLDWIPLIEPMPISLFEFIDPEVDRYPQRFFRSRARE